MSAWEDVLLDSGDQRKPAEWWWAYVTGVDPLRIRRELETHPIGSTPSTIEANLQIGDKVRVVNYLGQALIVGRAGGTRGPFAEAAGRVAIPFTSDQVEMTVTFPANRFTQTPIVTTAQAQQGLGAGVLVSVHDSLTAQSMVLRANAQGSGYSGTLTVFWRAVQMTPTSASG